MSRRSGAKRRHGTCYMCDMPATTREHVPPKCFFPEQKDVGINYRKSLLTVPSCDLHNSEKSEDDAFLQFVITSYYKNKVIAQKQFSTKNMRAIERNRSQLDIFSDSYPVLVGGQLSLASYIDRPRLDKGIEHITRALYFYHHQKRLDLPIKVSTPDLLMDKQPNADEINYRTQKIKEVTINVLGNEPEHGENPDIFSYQFKNIEDRNLFLVRMVFYGGFAVTAYASPAVEKK